MDGKYRALYDALAEQVKLSIKAVFEDSNTQTVYLWPHKSFLDDMGDVRPESNYLPRDFMFSDSGNEEHQFSVVSLRMEDGNIQVRFMSFDEDEESLEWGLGMLGLSLQADIADHLFKVYYKVIN